ncbi:MAG: hypothetical protein KY461_06620 [Actinobacteria bacterium]|nr:hypothetical protein [Actinomycetota bacterium]
MTTTPGPALPRLAALAAELRLELDAARSSGHTARADQLRGELALLEDLALPEAVGELQLQRITYTAASQAMGRVLPVALRGFLA